MNTPRIKYYARLDYNRQSGETPKYTITEEAGFMPEMEQLKGRDGKVSMYFMRKNKDDKGSTPPMRLQAKGNLNFTGLKDRHTAVRTSQTRSFPARMMVFCLWYTLRKTQRYHKSK